MATAWALDFTGPPLPLLSVPALNFDKTLFHGICVNLSVSILVQFNMNEDSDSNMTGGDVCVIGFYVALVLLILFIITHW